MGPIRTAISSVREAREKERRWEEVETARSYKSCEAANAYNSRGYEGACERSNENKWVEGAMRVFEEMP